MLSAHRDVAFVTADFDLFALFNGAAIGVGAEVHSGFTAAVADGFKFDEIVCPAKQCGAAREEVALEIGAQAVAEHGDFDLVGDLAELLDLLACEKLRFINQHTGNGFLFVGCAGGREQIVRVFKRPRLFGESDARGNGAGTGSLVDFRCKQQSLHTALLVIVAGLQEDGAFARVHCGIVEVEFCH